MSSISRRTAACALALAVAGLSLAHPALGAPTLGGCPLLPANHILNTKVDTLPVHPRSAAWIANVVSGGDGANRTFHMDFGSGQWEGAPIGIPYVVVDGAQPKVPVSFAWWDESDPGPYPIPPGAPIEGVGPPDAGGDRHVLVAELTNCKIYETFNSWPQNGGTSWAADSGAVFDLRSNALRPAGWTSADAAGLPMIPLLVRYDEVATGAIEHALRFTVPRTQRAYVWPARHYASSITDPNVAPMGARFRLKASVDIGRFTGEARVIAQAMKTYGIILADNGSAWFVNGSPDPRWNNTVLAQLKQLRGGDFEAVDVSSLMLDPDSGEAAGAAPPPPPPPTPSVTVTVVKAGRGSGTVSSSDGSIACGSDCSGQVPAGTPVTLTAAARPNSVFQGWSGGGCGGTAPCTLSPAANVQVTATFRRKNE